MLHLTCSNQMEALIEPLAAQIEAARQADALAPVTLVVPDQAVAQYLRFRLAERLGVAAHLQFTFLTRFLAERVEAADATLKVLTADQLELLLFARLRDPTFLNQEGLEKPRSYLDRASTTSERETRALQLASQLARLFEEYGYSRRDMVRAWRRGPVLHTTPAARTERWQRLVWRALFEDDGAARVALLDPQPAETQADLGDDLQLGLFAPAPTGPRFMLLADAVAVAQRRGLSLPGPVHVFGLSYVAPAFAEIFARLAVRSPLFVYAINPCMEFWEDVEHADESLRRAVRDGWLHQGERLPGLPGLEAPEVMDPFELDRPGDTPALRLWGRPGREYVRLLNQLSDCRFHADFRDPGHDTLLARIQRDVLTRMPERPVATEGEPDASLRFLACPGIRREVEIVADQIWACVRERAASGKPLRFHQIAVMVADPRREDYLTHLDAVFRERHDLPFNLIDRPLAGQSRVMEAIDRLLTLPTGEFEYSELMRLLTHPAVGAADPDSDPARWRRWGDALNIRFGADHTDLETTYIDRDVFNWDQALRRLVLGACVMGEKAGDDRPVELSSGVWMPFETAPDALGEVGRLVALARCLIADARMLRTATLQVGEWAVLLARVFTRYLTATRVDDELALSRALAALEQLGAADLEGTQVGFEVARALVRERLAGLEGGRGQHQADGVVVSSLMPMRAVPFEAVFVVGLGEGRFPAPARNHPLDLRFARRQAGDVTPGERDRYLFLETLLAARWRLVLSWVARDATTGDPLEPSSVIKELQYLLRGYLPPDRLVDLVTAHPVSSYDLSYFPDLQSTPGSLGFGLSDVNPENPSVSTIESGLVDEEGSDLSLSASVEARRGAQARALRIDVERHLDVPPPERAALLDGLAEPARDQLTTMLRLPIPPAPQPGPPERLILPLYALQRFLESPLQGAARYVLGLRDDGSSDVDPEELEVDRQARTTLLREAFFAGRGEAAAVEAAWRAGFERLVLKGEAPVGLFADVRSQEDLALLGTWGAHLQALELPALDQWLTYRVGRARGGESTPRSQPSEQSGVSGEPSAEVRLLDPLEFQITLPDGRLRAVELHGRLLPLAPDGSATLRCHPGKAAAEKHFLPGFLTVAALAAAGQPLPPVVRAVVLPGGEASIRALEHRYAVPPVDLCRQWFMDLVTDLVSEVHAYRMPIESVLEWQKDRATRSDARFFIRRGVQDHGPVRDPERFPMPELSVLRALVDRRLGLWFDAGKRA